MSHILFVCTANLCRSPLAAAFLRRKLHEEYESQGWMVESAGTWAVPGQQVPSTILKAAAEEGVDLAGHRARRVDGEVLRRFDLVFVMERGHREALWTEFPSAAGKIHLLSEAADGLEYDIADPANSGEAARAVVKQMRELIDRAFANLCQLGQPLEMVWLHRRRHVNFTL